MANIIIHATHNLMLLLQFLSTLPLHQNDQNVTVGNLGQKVATNLGRKMTSSPEVQQQQQQHLDVIAAAQRWLLKGVKRAPGY